MASSRVKIYSNHIVLSLWTQKGKDIFSKLFVYNDDSIFCYKHR